MNKLGNWNIRSPGRDIELFSLHFFISLPQDSKSFPQHRKSFPQVKKSFPQDSKSCFDANVQAIFLSMIPNLYRGHPSTSMPFKFTYPCRPGYHFINFNGYSSKLPNY